MPTSNNLLSQARQYIADFMNIRQDTDRDATVEGIKADISFRGHTSWILICSIVIASLGLSANSPAVIIGAMLISPLMGPILGIALSLATNDVDLLRRALKNFGVMVFLSVASAFVFFWFFPLRDASSELLARTSPDIRDVLIAFFGGLALVIARAKKGTMASVIFGVAIATALMPPLCTVGFFLANGDWRLAFGALYLFLINAIFIAAATFIVLRYLQLPMAVYTNSPKRKRISRIAYFLAILLMVPAGYTFYEVWRVSQFKNNAAAFIAGSIETYPLPDGARFLRDLSKIEYNNGTPTIDLVFYGDAAISDEVVELWNRQKETYPYLRNARLQILSNSRADDPGQYIQELYTANKEQLISSRQHIRLLEQQLAAYEKYGHSASRFGQITKEMAVNYPTVAAVTFANELKSDFSRTDTVPVFRIRWKQGVAAADRQRDAGRLRQWLNLRLGGDSIVVREE